MAAAPSQNSLPGTLAQAADPAFDRELCGLVLDTAPRLFAVVQVCDEGRADADGWVAAWGFADAAGSTHVIGVDGRTRLTLPSPERAAHHFSRRPGITARLVWLSPPTAAATDRAEAA
ncbi:hypothetical protein [Streptomyces sp. CBMA156]|uniref:hypothetical protein n=1 Tax=Streptomyces sp. CBMA156 TaxID=1930280 RepID=UPI001CB83224|nr:hypothetical protein [Streptomyces sp. CBMA156]MBD0672908.1 hypothetical protein [Streptomyces sp. CBMA156]